MNRTYENWKAVTEADFVSLFVKTWFAYISTLREMFPEAYNRRGDKKYLNSYKQFYQKEGYKKLIVDENIMGSIEMLYREGRKIIMEQYPEYYLWDFYRINDDFEFTYKDIPPDKKDCLVIGLKLYRNRGTSHSFIITGFVRFWGEFHKSEYNENLKFEFSLTEILNSVEQFIKENPKISEQDFLAYLLNGINDQVNQIAEEAFEILKAKEEYNKWILSRISDVKLKAIAVIRSIFALNGKDETFKNEIEMDRARNTYEIIQQRPMKYFQYHMDVDWQPQGKLTTHDEVWFKSLFDNLKKYSIIWFLDFVYRLRNALFHEIIDPLNEDWQVVFKNAYLVLKEIVDLNIAVLPEFKK